MGRYDRIQVQKDADGVRQIRPVLYPNIPFNNKDIYVRTSSGDRLDTLAYQFYKNVSYWWIIAHANNVGKGTFALPPNQQIRIPANPIQIQLDFEQLNK